MNKKKYFYNSWFALILIIATGIFLPTNAGAVTKYATSTGTWTGTVVWRTGSCAGAASVAPVAGDDVIICDGVTVTVNASILTIVRNLTVGQGASGVLTFSTAGSYRLDILGNLTINTGAQISYTTVAATARQHSIWIIGNLTNSGTVNVRQTTNNYVYFGFWSQAGTPTNSTVSSSGGTWTTLTYISLNKKTTAEITEIQDANFTSALNTGAPLLTSPYGAGLNPPVTFVASSRGVYKHNNAGTLNFRCDPNSISQFTIPDYYTFEVNAGTVNLGTVAGLYSTVLLRGGLTLAGGTVNISQSATDIDGHSLSYYANVSGNIPKLYITSGTLNVYGQFSNWVGASDPIDFQMSGGTMTVNMGTASVVYESFFINTNASNNVNISGGTIIIQKPSSYTGTPDKTDFCLGNSGTYSVTGGTVQFGNASTAAATFRFTAISTLPGLGYPDIVISNASGNAITLLPWNNANFIFKSLTINSGTTFDIRDATISNDTKAMTIMGNNGTNAFFNNGTFTQRTGTVTFGSSTSNQTIAGTTATVFYNLIINNTYATSPQITASVNLSATNALTMTAGRINLGTTTLTLGSSAATPGTLNYTSGFMYSSTGTFKRWFNTPSIAVGNVSGHFPMGTSAGHYRPVWIGYATNLAAGGTVSVLHTPAYPSGTTAASHADASWGNTLQGISNSSWTVSTANSFAVSGSNNGIIRFGGTGFGTFVLTDLDASLAASVAGTHSAATSVNTPLEVNRTGLTTAQLANTWYVGSRNIAASPLPVEFLSFNALPNGSAVDINWSTAVELNNDYFIVQRSKDAIYFTDVAQADGAGNSSTIKYYSSVDHEPYNGVSFYRLKQVDFNGAFSFSNIIPAEFNTNGSTIFSVYPTLSSGYFHVSFAGNKDQRVAITVRDILGKEIYSQEFFPDKDLLVQSVNLSGIITPGVYTVFASSLKTVFARRIVIK